MNYQISTKNIFFILLTSLLIVPGNALHQASYTYVVKFQGDPKDTICLKGTYKGDVIDFSEGLLGVLPEPESVNSFELIITSEHPKMSSGDMRYLERISEVPCDWYNITWSKEGAKTVWSVEKRAEESMPLRIPNNALIICYPPEFVEKIENKAPQESSSTVIHLPIIELKKNLSGEEKEKRDSALNRSALAHLEVSGYLSPATQLVKKGNKVKLARGV